MDTPALAGQALEVVAGGDVVHREMFLLLGQAEVILHLLVVDAEHRPGAGHVRLGHQLEQPFDRRDGFHLAAVPGVATGGLVADDLHGVPRGRVDRLDAPVEQHRQLAEAVNVRLLAVDFWHAHQPHQGPQGHDYDDNDRDGQFFHAAAFRFLLNENRWVKNWMSNPRPTSAQEMYGVTQAGFRTTCRTVARGFSGSKLA